MCWTVLSLFRTCGNHRLITLMNVWKMKNKEESKLQLQCCTDLPLCDCSVFWQLNSKVNCLDQAPPAATACQVLTTPIFSPGFLTRQTFGSAFALAVFSNLFIFGSNSVATVFVSIVELRNYLFLFREDPIRVNNSFYFSINMENYLSFRPNNKAKQQREKKKKHTNAAWAAGK